MGCGFESHTAYARNPWSEHQRPGIFRVSGRHALNARPLLARVGSVPLGSPAPADGPGT